MNYESKSIKQRFKIKNYFKFCVVIFSFALFALRYEPVAAGENQLTLTVTPPLIQLNLEPGQTETGTIKVINSNPFELSVYASVSGFEATGEVGQGRLVPLANNELNVSGSLANWIDVPLGSIVISPESSADIPFIIHIPAKAEPGGHYAAILIGTEPPPASAGGSVTKVSSAITSLVFARISGDILESGHIREWRTEKTFLTAPKTNFIMRFENSGNVHLRPQGEITIYNMLGQGVAKLPFNQGEDFGNVLPKSVRKFEIDWATKEELASLGRLKAELILSFGNETRQNAAAVIYFWIIPWREIAAALGGFLLVIIFITWSVKRYIKKTITKHLARF